MQYNAYICNAPPPLNSVAKQKKIGTEEGLKLTEKSKL